MENVSEVIQKMKNLVPCNQSISLLGIYTQKIKILTQRDICTPMFIATLFTIAKTLKQPKSLSVDKWEEIVVHIHNGILFSHKNEEIMSFMDVT